MEKLKNLIETYLYQYKDWIEPKTITVELVDCELSDYLVIRFSNSNVYTLKICFSNLENTTLWIKCKSFEDEINRHDLKSFLHGYIYAFCIIENSKKS